MNSDDRVSEIEERRRERHRILLWTMKNDDQLMKEIGERASSYSDLSFLLSEIDILKSEIETFQEHSSASDKRCKQAEEKLVEQREANYRLCSQLKTYRDLLTEGDV